MSALPPFAELPVDEEALLARLAHLPAATDVPTAAAATGVPPRLAHELMRSLTGKGLLTAAPGGAVRGTLYTLHPDAAAQARTLAPAIGPETLGRYLDALVETAEQASRLLTPNHRLRPQSARRHRPGQALQLTNGPEARSWLESAVPSLLTVLAAARQAREDAAGLALVTACFAYFHLLCDRDLWIPVHEQGLLAAERCHDQAAVRSMLHTLAMGHRDQGRHDAAIARLTRAREIATATGDEAGIAQHTRGIGACHHAAGRHAEALPYLEQARALLRPLGQPRDLALTLILLGSSRTALGEPGTAIDLLEEALRLLDTLPGHDAVNIGRTRAFLGEAHSAAGGRPEATAHLARALAQFAETGAQHWVARTMLLLGEAARRADDEKTARIWFNASLGMFQALGRTNDTKRLVALLDGGEGR